MAIAAKAPSPTQPRAIQKFLIREAISRRQAGLPPHGRHPGAHRFTADTSWTVQDQHTRRSFWLGDLSLNARTTVGLFVELAHAVQ
jgi:hypothetical protein